MCLCVRGMEGVRTLIVASSKEDSPGFIADQAFSDFRVLVLRPTKGRITGLLTEDGVGTHYFHYQGVPIRPRLQSVNFYEHRLPQPRLVYCGGSALWLSCCRRGFGCHPRERDEVK